MSEILAYVCAAVLPESTLYFLWLSNGDEPDSVLVDRDGRVPAFTEETSARDHGARCGYAVAADAPVHYDLARVSAWCEAPDAATLDCVLLLNTWNLLADLGPQTLGVTSLFGYQERRANSLYDRLFFGNNLPSITPAGAHYTPEWDTGELNALSAILRRGVAEFAARLHVA